MTVRTSPLLFAALLCGCGAPDDPADPPPVAGPAAGVAEPGAAPAGDVLPDARAAGLDPAAYAAAWDAVPLELTYEDAAPQDYGPLDAPPGAVKIGYRPGGWPEDADPLAAFVTPDPGDGERRPAVLFLHGGFAWGPSDWEDAAALRDAGFVVFTPVLSGENGQPGTFSLFFDEVSDVLAAAEVLANLPYVDKDRIYIAGHSAGGTLALLAAEFAGSRPDFPVRFAGAASLSGLPDVRAALGDPEDARAVIDPADARQVAVRSFGAFMPSLACPALLVRGAEEEWLAPATDAAVAAARAAGKTAEAVTVPGDHFSMLAPGVRRAAEFFRGLDAP